MCVFVSIMARGLWGKRTAHGGNMGGKSTLRRFHIRNILLDHNDLGSWSYEQFVSPTHTLHFMNQRSSTWTMCWWDILHISDYESGSLWSPKKLIGIPGLKRFSMAVVLCFWLLQKSEIHSPVNCIFLLNHYILPCLFFVGVHPEEDFPQKRTFHEDGLSSGKCTKTKNKPAF